MNSATWMRVDFERNTLFLELCQADHSICLAWCYPEPGEIFLHLFSLTLSAGSNPQVGAVFSSRVFSHTLPRDPINPLGSLYKQQNSQAIHWKRPEQLDGNLCDLSLAIINPSALVRG